MNFFDLDREKADALIIELERESYIKKAGRFRDEQLWGNTIKGNALALASAAKPILRSTAERKINEFLERVKEVNRNDYYLYKIKKVVVFGSYLSDAEKLGDIDLAIEIVPIGCWCLTLFTTMERANHYARLTFLPISN